MTPSLLHPIALEAIEPPRRAMPSFGQVAGLAALIVGVLVLGLALG